MDFAPSFFKEETRSGFLVTEKRKKIWATELEILERFDEVCKKFPLSYYAGYGTLLGAVRHQGFIPWDDDIDVLMFRNDYEELQSVAPWEFTEPYCFQNTYSGNIIWALSKIRDSRTTAIEFRDISREFNQGIFIDIFPLDSVPDPVNPQSFITAGIQKLLWNAIVDSGSVLTAIEQGKQFILDSDFLLDYLKKDYRQRFRIFEEFNLSHFGESQAFDFITDGIYQERCKSVQKEWFKDTIYLPFENIQIPAPAEYDKVLTRLYGDYHQLVQGASDHEGTIMEPDIPYKEYFAKYLD